MNQEDLKKLAQAFWDEHGDYLDRGTVDMDARWADDAWDEISVAIRDLLTTLGADTSEVP